ncbi:MAG: alpha/beta hydrolase [Lachnospiraceae bacterium]|nr:alpha/beta hydrolase [Lachnospiraceae bacterium]
MENRIIPGYQEGTEQMLRIYRPQGISDAAPGILANHGGGFTGGDLDIDDTRCAFLAEHTPCVVVSAEYSLCSETVHYPTPLLDVVNAWKYLCEHAQEWNLDSQRMGLHGTSAGGNLAAGLSLYIRNHRLPAPLLTALNCPILTDEKMHSTQQIDFGPMTGEEAYMNQAEHLYYPGEDGREPPYYAMPLYCRDLTGLNPHYIVTAYSTPCGIRESSMRDGFCRSAFPASWSWPAA